MEPASAARPSGLGKRDTRLHTQEQNGRTNVGDLRPFLRHERLLPNIFAEGQLRAASRRRPLSHVKCVWRFCAPGLRRGREVWSVPATPTRTAGPESGHSARNYLNRRGHLVPARLWRSGCTGWKLELQGSRTHAGREGNAPGERGVGRAAHVDH